MNYSELEPLWYKDAVIYQLHVKSFFDSNDDGYGDFPGLMQKLDYLQELGVDTIWLLPFYPSPLRDDGYDIADYEGINPVYGDRKDFRNFVREAHNRGLKVITELVINHTSDQHPWFDASRKAPPGSSKRDFYVWSDTDTKYQDARIIFLDSEKSNWTWDPIAKQYYWHRFFHHQPDLNFDNPNVRRAIIKIMKFWLDLGVDGMRLDAIPYLIEREGTNCENLPDTHAILKEMRKVLDEEYPNRIFLAEANQWPTEVIQYFGNSDECHMAFHFPVMPRIYLAVHQEDRHPITEILRQTPDIPYDCQWAMFLRNHDELTLEMVTDDERDYMYNAYAHDPMMRINLGIRRRLAPLLDYSRDKIKLLNSILFSMPGTPIVYYGDEIGMGENIFLGDRHGVRTPMQWNGDRNAGFSKALFAKLYSAPIMDPVTGYQAINVEAQNLDPSSLLNWMRSVIKLRKQHKVFGRGTLEILYPENRKILAYKRSFEGETVLVVANLSRYPQSVSLDLPDYAGVTPIEMFGLVPFHPITEEKYTLTLAGHSFYWLQLATNKVSPFAETAPLALKSVESQSIYVVDTVSSINTLLTSPFKKILENRIIPQFIRGQRWFGKKSKNVTSTKVNDWIDLSASTGLQSGMLVLEIHYSDGEMDLYNMFVALEIESQDSDAQALPSKAPAIIAELTDKDRKAILYDALDNEKFNAGILSYITEDKRIRGQVGFVESFKLPAFEVISAKGELASPVKRVESEQSNSSIIYGNRFILKLFRHLEPGLNPDYEISRYLTETSPFSQVPAAAGVLGYTNPRLATLYTLGLLQEYVQNQGDAWSYTVAEFRRYYERCSTKATLLSKMTPPAVPLSELVNIEPPEEVFELLGVYIKDAAKLGARTAEMHIALGKPSDLTAFQPEPISRNELIDISSTMRYDVVKVFKLLEQKVRTAEPDLVNSIKSLLLYRPKVVDLLDRLATINEELTKIRCHGDYHLGQVLYSGGDFFILDFEGEPSKPLELRIAKQTPLKDVAGMVRSFSYASYASLFLFTHNRAEDLEAFLPWAKACEAWSSASFLKGYLQAMEGSSLVPSDRSDFFRALLPFMIDKAFYEIFYEVNNRPDWLRVPVSSVLEYLKAGAFYSEEY
ncbi:MAG: maltose alpha-D-glucosyltransferase [Candidatus Melainabacteria bacterium]|nr:MAG: maltose alpha-D-glucosyltransferase [Candidatus Melainabacteria bacterium]